MGSLPEKIELFHLLFLDQFGRKTDKNLYALKGGCNLRFFMKSVRYSEDIGLDVHTIGKETLANKVDRILASAPFQAVLAHQGLAIGEVTKPKQTETVQRWKLSINDSEGGFPARTRLEFSRRRFDEGVAFESIDPVLARRYRIHPPLVNHYSLRTAFSQKVEALLSRTETQGRDVFDLDLLLRSGATAGDLPPGLRSKAGQAVDRALSISFADFKAQVWAFLEPEYQSQYDSAPLWEGMVHRLADALTVGVG